MPLSERLCHAVGIAGIVLVVLVFLYGCWYQERRDTVCPGFTPYRACLALGEGAR